MFGVHLEPSDVPCCYSKEGEWASLSVSRILSSVEPGNARPTDDDHPSWRVVADTLMRLPGT